MTKTACVVIGEGAAGSWSGSAISSMGKPYDLMVGVSSGCLNACGYSLLGSDLVELWRSIDSILDVFEMNPCAAWQSGLMQPDPLIRKLRGAVLGRRFSFSVMFPTIDVRTSDLDWHCFEAGCECDDEAIHLIAAASAIPGLCRDVRGRVDGGLRTICPLKSAIDAGADEIDVVMAGAPFQPPGWPALDSFRFFKATEFAARAVETMLWEIMVRDIERALDCNSEIGRRKVKIRIIYPGQRIGWVLGFSDCREMTDLVRYPIQQIELV